MILPGHLALALLAHTYGNVDFPTTVAGTLAPDVIDKSLSHVLRVTPSGRYVMHSWMGLAVSTLLVRVCAGSERAKAWGIGYMAHFLGDRGEIPWWFPFRAYDDLSGAEEMDSLWLKIITTSRGRRRLMREFFLLFLSVAAWLGHRRAGDR